MTGPASKDETFDRLRLEISRDLKPVRPLSSAWVRVLFLVPYALLALAVLLLVSDLRADAPELGPEILWGLATLQLLVAYLVFSIALRQAVPGDTAGSKPWLGFPALVLGVQFGVAMWTYRYSGLVVPPERVVTYGLVCFGMMAVIGLAPLAGGLLLLSRGLPLKPRLAGLVSGFAAGLLAEAVYRTHCSFSQWSHIVPWHGGAVVLLGLAGFWAGLLWDERRLREWRTRHSPRPS